MIFNVMESFLDNNIFKEGCDCDCNKDDDKDDTKKKSGNKKDDDPDDKDDEKKDKDDDIDDAIDGIKDESCAGTGFKKKDPVNEAYSIILEGLFSDNGTSVDQMADNIEMKLKAINNPYAKDFEKPVDTAGALKPSRVKQMIAAISNIIEKKKRQADLGQRYPLVLRIQREVMELYKEIGKILQNDAALSTDYANEYGTALPYKDIQIKDKKSGKPYQYSMFENQIPFDQIYNICMQIAYFKDHSAIKDFKKNVFDFLYNNYWFIFECTPVIAFAGEETVSFTDHIIMLRNDTDNVNRLLYNLTSYLSQNTQFIAFFQKTYMEVQKVYESRAKDAYPTMEEIYAECLRYSAGIVDFNFKAHDLLFELMVQYRDQMKAIYKKIYDTTNM